MERQGAFTRRSRARPRRTRERASIVRLFVCIGTQYVQCEQCTNTTHRRVEERHKVSFFFQAVHRTHPPPPPRYLKHASGIVSFSSVARLLKTQRSGSKAGHDSETLSKRLLPPILCLFHLFLLSSSLFLCLSLLSFLSFELVLDFALATSPEGFLRDLAAASNFYRRCFQEFGGSSSLG